MGLMHIINISISIMAYAVALFFLQNFSPSFVKMDCKNHEGLLAATDLIGLDKGSHPLRKVQFFLTLFKSPLAPPPLSFEHHVVNFF